MDATTIIIVIGIMGIVVSIVASVFVIRIRTSKFSIGLKGKTNFDADDAFITTTGGTTINVTRDDNINVYVGRNRRFSHEDLETVINVIADNESKKTEAKEQHK
jgi:hypothetical protein